MPSTGKTQGIRLRMSPPMKARASVPIRLVGPGGVTWVAGLEAGGAAGAAEPKGTSTRRPLNEPSASQPFSAVSTPRSFLASAGPSGEIGKVRTNPPWPSALMICGSS